MEDWVVSPLKKKKLFFVALGLLWRIWAFSSCGEQALLFVAVHRLLIAVVSLVVETGSNMCMLP